MNKEKNIKKMEEFVKIKEKGLKEKTVDVKNMTIYNLRDSITGLGTILDEDIESNTYIISVSAGAANMNAAIVAAQLFKDKLYLLAYAREGLINQNTAIKAMDKIIKRIEKYIG